jgi:hypothetical protein
MAQETFEEYDLKEWKVIYLTLYNSILKNDDLIDLKFMDDLQKYLQQKAEGIGLDPLDHDTWINWLNNVKNTPSPSASILDREVLPESNSKKRRTLQHV